MSIKATNFVRRLRGLTPTEKLVAFVIADHCNHKTELSDASMTTIAAECGLAFRQVASRIVNRLAERRVIVPHTTGTGRGHTTAYRLNYSLTNCDPRVTLSQSQKRNPTDALNDTGKRNPTDALNPEQSATAKLESATLEPPKVPESATPQLHEGLRTEGVPVFEVGTGFGISEVASSSSSEGGFAKPDDDDTGKCNPTDALNLSPKTIPHFNGNGNGKPKPSVEEKQISPALRSWARTRILARATAVRNKSAYLKASEDEFFKNLPTELELFYTECAESFIGQRLESEPDVIIPYDDVLLALIETARKFGLPAEQDMLLQAIRAAGAVLGAVEKPLHGRPN